MFGRKQNREVKRGGDLPFERDQSTRFLPWIIAPMVFLAIMSLAAVELIGGIVNNWDAQLSGSMTIQVPRQVPRQVPGQDSETQAERVERALAFAIATPGVAHVREMPAAAARALLEPWLGTVAGDLPIPAIIEVTLEPAAILDSEIFAERLADVVAGALVDDHRVWLDGLIGLADIVMKTALAGLLLITASASAAVIYATRSGLTVHSQIIDLLHHMGAYDGYIARQFQKHFMRICARGGVIGSLLAALCLGAMFYVGRDIEATLLPPLALSGMQWLSLAAIPTGTIVIAMLTTRVTVLRVLARLP